MQIWYHRCCLIQPPPADSKTFVCPLCEDSDRLENCSVPVALSDSTSVAESSQCVVETSMDTTATESIVGNLPPAPYPMNDEFGCLT